MRRSQDMKGVIMRNLRDTIFYMKANVLQDFHINISVPLIISQVMIEISMNFDHSVF